jgi:hypothetical protein
MRLANSCPFEAFVAKKKESHEYTAAVCEQNYDFPIKLNLHRAWV